MFDTAFEKIVKIKGSLHKFWGLQQRQKFNPRLATPFKGPPMATPSDILVSFYIAIAFMISKWKTVNVKFM
jgi:hypothetical protein